MKKYLISTIVGIGLFFGISYGANYDILDPRLPGYEQSLIYRFRVAAGYSHTYNHNDQDYQPNAGFNKTLFDYLSSEQKQFLARQWDDVKFNGLIRLKENWVGINEADENYSDLQTSLTLGVHFTIKDKIEVCNEVSFYRSDSTYNLDDASRTGEFLSDPLISHNFENRGAIASGIDIFELQTERAFIKTEAMGVAIQTGRDRLQLKNGYRNGLMLSGLTRPIDMYYRLDYSFWRIGITALAGQMTEADRRYIAVKRVTLRLADNLQLGATEAAANFDDPMVYINPIALFYIVHRHRTDNEDNLIACFDFSYTPFKSFNIYGEFLDDDYIMFKGGASKYGYLLGLFKTGLFDERLDMRLEYAKVRKWTYTHASHLNPWEYRGQPFGFWLGPDADELYTQVTYLFNPRFNASLNIDYARKGEGDLYHPYEDDWEQDKTPPFPSGIVEKSIGGWVDVRYNIDHLELRGRLGYRSIDNRGNQPNELDSYFMHMTFKIEL